MLWVAHIESYKHSINILHVYVHVHVRTHVHVLYMCDMCVQWSGVVHVHVHVGISTRSFQSYYIMYIQI